MGEKVPAEELNKMKLDFGNQDGPKRGEARCEKCGTIYPVGTPHGCKIDPTKKVETIGSLGLPPTLAGRL